MSTLRVWAVSWKNAVRQYRLVLIWWSGGLLVALPLFWLAHRVFVRSFSYKQVVRDWDTGFQLTPLLELLVNQPMVGTAFAGCFTVLAVLGWLWAAFATAGAMGFLKYRTEKSGPFVARFFTYGGKYAGRFLRLSATLLCAIALSLSFLCLGPSGLALTVPLIILSIIVGDVTRSALMNEDGRSAVRTFFRSWIWLFRRGGRLVFFYGLSAAALIGGLGLYKVLDTEWSARAPILLMAAVQQMFVLFRAAVRIQILDGLLALTAQPPSLERELS